MKKKTKLILLILILILLVLILRTTYSKYANVERASVSERIGKWVIKVNSVDITAYEETKFLNLEDFIWEDNGLAEENMIAPGSKGHFELVIDPDVTDTSIEYTITIDLTDFKENLKESMGNLVLDDETYVTPFKVTECKEKNGKTLNIENKDDIVTISRVKELSEIKSEDLTVKLDEIEIKLEWLDERTHDVYDSILGSKHDQVVTIPVSIKAIQYVRTNP